MAHNPNETYCKVLQKENRVEVETELPWTIRNAVLKQYPTLEKSKIQADLDKAFFDYVSQNLVLKDKQNKVLALKEVKPLLNNGETHSNRYLFVYEGVFEQIENRLLFNLYDTQQNYLDIEQGNEVVKFVTTPKAAIYYAVEQANDTKPNYVFYEILSMFILAMSCVYAVQVWKKRKK